MDEHPEKVAFFYEGQISGEKKQITYKELLDLVEKFADVLVQIGLKVND